MKKVVAKSIFFVLMAFFSATHGRGQGMAVNATGAAANSSAILDVSSTTQGMLIPRMDSIHRGSISNPATGLLVFQTDQNSGFYYNIGTPVAPYWLKLGMEKTATYRWATFSTYNQSSGWIMDNNASLFGGVNPSTWTDANGNASGMSSDKEVLRTLFTQKGYANANAMVYSETYAVYSSTNGKIVAVLFRVRNTTSGSIVWTPQFYYSAFTGWGEVASVALNGVNQATYTSTGSASLALSLPANQTSTVIFVSSGDVPTNAGGGMQIRTVQLGFFNNSLTLPYGLSFVDDLDSATGGWGE